MVKGVKELEVIFSVEELDVYMHDVIGQTGAHSRVEFIDDMASKENGDIRLMTSGHYIRVKDGEPAKEEDYTATRSYTPRQFEKLLEKGADIKPKVIVNPDGTVDMKLHISDYD